MLDMTTPTWRLAASGLPQEHDYWKTLCSQAARQMTASGGIFFGGHVNIWYQFGNVFWTRSCFVAKKGRTTEA